jgi:type VI secretion system protein ImpL
MQWPGPEPGTEVRIELRDRQSGATAMERLQGPWAWFRLLDKSNLAATNVPEQFEVAFSVNGRSVLYDLIARSAFNPFALPQLQQFECPGTL